MDMTTFFGRTLGPCAVFLALSIALAGCGGGSLNSGGNIIQTGPQITSVSPDSIPTSGNVTLTITGSGFQSNGALQGAELVVGPALVPASNYQIGVSNVTINSDTSATVNIPADSYNSSPAISLASFAYNHNNISLVLTFTPGINGYAQSPVIPV
jgi:hypothetical protein